MEKITDRSKRENKKKCYVAVTKRSEAKNVPMSDLIAIYILEAISHQFEVPEDAKEHKSLYHALYTASSTCFDTAVLNELSGKKMGMQEFKSVIRPGFQTMAIFNHKTDDVHTKYLYNWAITRAWELYQEVALSKYKLLDMLYNREYEKEEFLMPDDLEFNLIRMRTEARNAVLYDNLIENSGDLAESLIDIYELADVKPLFEADRKICSYLLCIGRLGASAQKAQKDALPILENPEKWQDTVKKILISWGLEKEQQDFVEAHPAESTELFALGMLAENYRILMGQADVFEIESIILYLKLLKENKDKPLEKRYGKLFS